MKCLKTLRFYLFLYAFFGLLRTPHFDFSVEWEVHFSGQYIYISLNTV
jgi:hypothetical protein